MGKVEEGCQLCGPVCPRKNGANAWGLGREEQLLVLRETQGRLLATEGGCPCWGPRLSLGRGGGGQPGGALGLALFGERVCAGM